MNTTTEAASLQWQRLCRWSRCPPVAGATVALDVQEQVGLLKRMSSSEILCLTDEQGRCHIVHYQRFSGTRLRAGRLRAGKVSFALRVSKPGYLGWVGQEHSYASGNPVLHTDRLGLYDTGSAAKDAVQKAIDTCGHKSTSAWGGPVVGVIVSLIFASDLNPEEFESQPKKCHPDVKCKQNCRPCIPPVGTLAYREDTSPASPPHQGVSTPHWHLYRMNQTPYNCQCFWVPVPDNKGGLGPSPPPPGAVPITPAGGGGVW
jgi:hypothetical protein